MTTSGRWRLGHRPGFDALRGVAVLLVVVSHFFPDDLVVAGQLGVAMFFALSGFLITTLLLEELDRSGRIALGAFYRRRATRLLPALLVLVAVVAPLGFVAGGASTMLSQLWPVLLYVQNWAVMDQSSIGLLDHTWSLAIEEQFYLVLPLLLLVSAPRMRRSALASLVVVLVLGSAALRAVLYAASTSDARIAFGTDTNACLPLVGVVAALWLSGRAPARSRPGAALLAVIGVVALALLLQEGASLVWAPVLAAVLTALAIVCLSVGATPSWWSPGWLTLVGRRSYGLYLWHFPVSMVYRAVEHTPLTLGLALALSWGLTLASWRYVEAPVLRRHRTRSVRARSDVIRTEPSEAPSV